MRDGFNFLRWEEKEFKIGTKYSITYLDIELDDILEDSSFLATFSVDLADFEFRAWSHTDTDSVF